MQRVMTTARHEGRSSPLQPGDHDSKALTVRVPTDLWKSVKIKCVQEDTNIQSVLADYLRDWIEEE